MSSSSIPIEAGVAADKWSDLRPKLSSKAIKCIEKKFGFSHTTPVQAATIPLLLSRKDVCVQVNYYYYNLFVFLVIELVA